MQSSSAISSSAYASRGLGKEAVELRWLALEGMGVVCFFCCMLECIGLLLGNVAYYRVKSCYVTGLLTVTHAPCSRFGLTEKFESRVFYFIFEETVLFFICSREASETGMPWKLLAGFWTEG